MSVLKKLAGQTVVYGLSSIVGRVMSFMLVPIFTRAMDPDQFGISTDLYAYAGFFAVLLTYGFETGFFRFATDHKKPEKVFSTALISLLTSSLAFLIVVLALHKPIAGLMQYGTHPEYILWFGIILSLDALAAIPFAKLRLDEKAGRFAITKVVEIAANIGINLFFFVLCPYLAKHNPNSVLLSVYNPEIGVGYMFMANVAASVLKIILLSDLFFKLKSGFDSELWKQMWQYAYPIIFIGLAGMVNELFDRATLKYLLPGTPEQNLHQLGIYGAVYKLAVFMSLFNQAFRYAAEPFFFSYAKEKDSKQLYADVLNYFFIFGCFIFLMITSFTDYFRYFISEDYWEGLFVLPILLLANLMLGVYVNLSIWYKLSDHTKLGALVAIGGSSITILLNLLWIPKFGYLGSAWATLICYSFMVIASFVLGKKYYPVPYDFKRLSFYLVLTLGFFFFFYYAEQIIERPLNDDLMAVALLAVFGVVVFVLERKKLVGYMGK